MDLSLQITRFIYRLRYKLLLPSIFVACVVAYFTQFIPNNYTVVASVFTGITSNKGLEDNSRNDYMALANTFDNVISFTKSKGSLERVSIKLLAQNLMYGDELIDNNYITAKNYVKLLEITPSVVLDLINKNSIDTTLINLNKYKESQLDNFIDELFNSTNPYYSHDALHKIEIKRFSVSDLLDLSYSSSDPGIATSTVELITLELIDSYHTFKYKSSDEVVSYYEEQLIIYQDMLNNREEELMLYNVKHRVINYTDQTRELASLMAGFEDRYERVLMEYYSSKDLIESLEVSMVKKSKLYEVNEEFLLALDQISTISNRITESEMFNNTDTLSDLNYEMQQRQQLVAVEKRIESISDRMLETQYSKEGIIIDDVVNHWLAANISYVKSKAELAVLEKRRGYYEQQQTDYSPIGTHLNRIGREIRIVEQSYLDALHHLGLARQRQNSIKLESSSPEIVSPASFPYRSSGRSRFMYVLVALVTTLVLITGLEIIIELIDRTLRDPIRAKELTSLETIGTLLGPKQVRYRGYSRESNRISARTICNKLNSFLGDNKTVYINIFSIESLEGKSYVSKYMKKAWEEQSLRVEVLNYKDDYLCGIDYLRANSLDFFKHQPADVVLIEYPALSLQSIPTVFLREANANILVANAHRGWKTSDDEYVKHLSVDINNKLHLILNNTDREYVEYLVCDMSINKDGNSVSDRINQLAFTSKGNGII